MIVFEITLDFKYTLDFLVPARNYIISNRNYILNA